MTSTPLDEWLQRIQTIVAILVGIATLIKFKKEKSAKPRRRKKH